MERARISDVTREQVIKFNEDFRTLIREKNVTLENIYNCDEKGMKTCIYIQPRARQVGQSANPDYN